MVFLSGIECAVDLAPSHAYRCALQYIEWALSSCTNEVNKKCRSGARARRQLGHSVIADTKFVQVARWCILPLPSTAHWLPWCFFAKSTMARRRKINRSLSFSFTLSPSSSPPRIHRAAVLVSSPSVPRLLFSALCLLSFSGAELLVSGVRLSTKLTRSRSAMTATTDNTSCGRHQRRLGDSVVVSRAFFYMVIGVLLCLPVSSSAAGYNASAHVNSDFAVNALTSGLKLIMLVESSPRNFSSDAFLGNLYNLYSSADKAIANISCVSIVNWCASNSNVLNTTISCPNGTKYNNNSNYTYVYVQVQLSGWERSTTVLPSSVDLSSAGVISSSIVAYFPGLHNPDLNTSGTGGGLILEFTSDFVLTYAVFGVLMAIAVFAFIGVAVCVCLCDNRQLNRNKSVMDRAIRAVHLNYVAALYGRRRHQQQQPTPAGFNEHYNMYADITYNGSADALRVSQHSLNSPQTNGGQATARGNDLVYSPREADNTHEMEEVGDPQSRDWDSAKHKRM
ncbi:hypothetical protein, unknown function [Leishmania braziliensis MHOM/BR/75/M2904]|uniref:Uncharacterized protein n=3 Tax=Viannia TaxID=37616 RepID=A4HF01_LEIBR|nr:hypothetical protein, unknown function [Leishmania braziliensis MHOM/BR/75/M2904]CAJ2474746.1 unnamed protein product [Leishmania braziliensis]CAM39410.1 hypothetical protein, unknown function [Leishmania braziliensis MHOM/BR/75/M2904]